MAQVTARKTPRSQTPKFVAAALAALERAFPGADTDSERVPGLDGPFYRLAIVSSRFPKGRYLNRHDLVWDVVKRALPKDKLERVSMILALRPEEFNGE